MGVCTKVLNFYGCTNATGTTCTKTAQIQAHVTDVYQANACPGSVLLSATEYTEYLTSLQNFGWNLEAFELGVAGALLAWATGVGVGLIIGQIRKMRAPT